MHITITELIERLQYCLEEYWDIIVVNREYRSKVDHRMDWPHHDERENKVYFEYY